MIEFVDIIVDLSSGDSGKGAVCYELSKRQEYTHVMRFNGSHNAGHTIFHNGQKFVTHIVPTGIFHDKTCIIGSGCVLNVKKFFEELEELQKFGIKTQNKIFIAENAHIVTDAHIQEELSEEKIGTTKQGVGPAYRDKYARTGIRAKDVPELQSYLINLYDYFFNLDKDITLLCEGAQGFNLDIDWGDYPFVSSSHATTAGALLNGIPYNKIRNVYGCAKAYDTYVGAKKFEPDDVPQLVELRKLGSEFGATTGRPRQCNWLDVRSLVKAVEMNGVTHVIISKLDVLRQLNKDEDNLHWCTRIGSEVRYHPSEIDWTAFIRQELTKYCSDTFRSLQFRNSPIDRVI